MTRQEVEQDVTGLSLLRLGEVRSFVVVSDVHVRSPEDARAVALVRWLNGLERERAEALFLLGDVFDFVDARSAYHRGLWRALFLALAKVRARGIAVYFVEGNHDFGFEHQLVSALHGNFDGAGDCVFAITHPVWGEVWLRHGDDVVCPPGYRHFRGLVKARPFQAAAGLVPGLFTHTFFSAYARLSRTRDKYRALDPAFFRSCLERYFESVKVTGKVLPNALVLGHVHVNLDVALNGVRTVAGPDWFSFPSAFFVHENGHAVREWIGYGSDAASGGTTVGRAAPEYTL